MFTALELVRLAQAESAGYATATVCSMLYTREAWAYAKLGRTSAFRRATDKAEDTLCEAKPTEDPYWINYFDVAELEGTTGGRLLDLAQQDSQLADEAAERISQAIALRRPGRSALDQLGLAEARLIQGEMEEASRLGHQAAALVEQTPSDRVRAKLAELYQHSNVHADVPVIASLRVLPAASYREKKVKADHAPQFDELMRWATTVRIMPFEETNRVAYEAANEALVSAVSACDTLLAVWDGQSGTDKGSTASVVEYARSRGVHVEVIWPDGAARD